MTPQYVLLHHSQFSQAYLTLFNYSSVIAIFILYYHIISLPICIWVLFTDIKLSCLVVLVKTYWMLFQQLHGSV